MTTIVWDSRTGELLSDSRLSEQSESGGIRQYRCQKVYKIEQAHLTLFVALAGDQSGLKFVRWVRDGMNYKEKPDFRKDDDFSALVVVTSAKPGGGRMVVSADVFDTQCEPEPIIEPYHAVGSGAKAAFCLFDQGVRAREIIHAVARRCPHTDNEVQGFCVLAD
jgi:hypothetical protein